MYKNTAQSRILILINNYYTNFKLKTAIRNQLFTNTSYDPPIIVRAGFYTHGQ